MDYMERSQSKKAIGVSEHWYPTQFHHRTDSSQVRCEVDFVLWALGRDSGN